MGRTSSTGIAIATIFILLIGLELFFGLHAARLPKFSPNNDDKTLTSSSFSSIPKSPTNAPLDHSQVRVKKDDFIYAQSEWDSSPVVLEEYKLIFFTIPKVACTVWKQLFRRMMGNKNWTLPAHNPKTNGLRYLHHYSLERATEFMTSPEYTRAIFVRDPKERFVSAFLDKVLNNGAFIQRKCCDEREKSCYANASASLGGFLRLAKVCDENDHWGAQSERMEDKYWSYIDFVGNMDNVVEDSKRLLKRVNAWERFGKKGWGKFQEESIFQTTTVNHATGAKNKMWRYDSLQLERDVEQFYHSDYQSPILNFTKKQYYNNQTATV